MERANVTLGELWVSDLIAGCQRARLAFPVCVTAERNHPLHLVVNQEPSTMPRSGLVARLDAFCHRAWVFIHKRVRSFWVNGFKVLM